MRRNACRVRGECVGGVGPWETFRVRAVSAEGLVPAGLLWHAYFFFGMAMATAWRKNTWP